MEFHPNYWTTVVGSFPYNRDDGLAQRLVERLDVPDWAQLARRSFRENMYVQYSPPLPGVVEDGDKQKIYFDTSRDLTPALETFYEHYLADDLDYFALRPDYCQGFGDLLAVLQSGLAPRHGWVKGQVTGPISFGLTVTDENLRASLYNEQLADVIVKNAALCARWQVRQYRAAGAEAFIFVDEPYLASYGSAFISLSREQVTGLLDEVFDAIHAEGALCGVHCCANTDWSLLLDTHVDILNLDAYGYLDNLALYPLELRAFLERGGVIAWGLVPNTEQIFQVAPPELAERLRAGLERIAARAAQRGVTLHPQDFAGHSLITTACGLGPAAPQVAECSLDVLTAVGEILQSA